MSDYPSHLSPYTAYVDQITSILEANQDNVQRWPKHISDPQRILIAALTLRKELFKLTYQDMLDQRSQDEFLDVWAHSVIDWLGWKRGQAPIHDFWNIFSDWMLGLKLKRLGMYLTAENVTWDLSPLPIDDLSLFWMNSLEVYPEIFGPKPWKVGQLRQQLAEHPEVLQALQEEALPFHQQFASRQQDPIFVLQLPENSELEPHLGVGKYRMPDGNGRVFNQLLFSHQPTIDAWVGKLNDPQPRNYWVSTGSLRTLAEGLTNSDTEQVQQANLTLLQDLFAKSDIARINFQLRCAQRYPELWQQLDTA